MKKKKLVKALEEVYGNMEALSEEPLGDATRFNQNNADKLGEIIQAIEDGDYDKTEEEKEEE